MPPSRRWLSNAWIMFAVIALGVFALILFLGNAAINLLTPWLEEQLKPRLGALYVPLLLTIIVTAAIIAVVSAVQGSLWNRQHSASETQRQPQDASPAQIPTLTTRVREELVDNVEEIWVQSKRDMNLPSPGLIDLKFAPRPNAVDRVGGHKEGLFKVWQRDLEASSTIPQVFSDARGRLLILGEPGSGKSTVLYTIAEHLINEARNDPNAPVPIIFELSEWSDRWETLDDWLVDRLNQGTLGISQRVARELVDYDRIAPLLDGLDEIADLAARQRCVDAINTFIQERRGRVPLVVCCRTVDFNRTQRRVGVQRAIVVKPLTLQQVQDYLGRAGPTLAGLCEAVRDQPALLKLAKYPLFLWLLTQNYRNTPSAEIIDDLRQGDIRDQILRTYVVVKDGAPTAEIEETLRVPPDELHARLIWLARGMQKHQQKVFHIELLQPTWLASRVQQRRWRMLVGLIIGPLSGISLGVFSGLVMGLVSGISLGALIGLVNGLLSMLGDTIILSERLRFGSVREIFTRHTVTDWLLFGVNSGVFGGLVMGLVSGLTYGLNEVLTGVLFGVLFGVLSIGLSVGIGSILQSSTMNIRTTPNQGITRSLSYGLLTGLLFGMLLGGLGGLLSGRLGGLLGVCGLFVGLFMYGGVAVIEHYVLRMLLCRSGALPLKNLVIMLDEAVARRLLVRVGGGYRFLHDILQDYYAEDVPPSRPIPPIIGP